MPTLREVRQAAFPTAVALHDPAEGALERPINWVRVLKARVPAFDALERGDLAIAPEGAVASLAAGSVEPAALVDAIHLADAAGVVFVGERDFDAATAVAIVGSATEATKQAGRRAGELGLPVFRLPGGDATQLERAIIGYLVNARAEVDRQAGRLEGQLEVLALGGSGPEEYAAAIATFLGRAVALEGPHGETLAVHAPAITPLQRPRRVGRVVGAGVGEPARDAARYLARAGSAALRVPLAGAGSLVLLGTAAPTELERTTLARVGPLLAIALGGGSVGGSRPARDDAMPNSGPPWVVLMARQVRAGATPPLGERETLRARLGRLAPGARLALRGDANSLELRLVAATDVDDPLGLLIASEVAVVADRLVAVSRSFSEPEGRALAEQEARVTLEAAERHESAVERAESSPERSRAGSSTEPSRAVAVARADRLPVYRLLGGLPDLPGADAEALALLAPLRQGSRALRLERLATLRAVLDHPGAGTAAAALGIHRNTLAYRLHRIESLTGWRLEDADLRLALGVALRLVQSDQF